jgi:hypothetical protein
MPWRGWAACPFSFFLAPCSILVACPLPVSRSTEEDGQQLQMGTPSEQQENPFLQKLKIKIICHLLPTSIWTTRKSPFLQKEKLKIICYPSRPTYPLTHPPTDPLTTSPLLCLVPGTPPGSQPEVSCFWHLTPLTYYCQFRINNAQPFKWNWVILVGWWGWLFSARRQGAYWATLWLA